MRVYLATQILSASVGTTLKEFGPETASGTSDFCLMMDKFFDCLNVRNPDEWKSKGKDYLKPYESPNDERLKENEKGEKAFLDQFLSYLEKWKKSIDDRKGEFTTTDRNNMFLSQQTYEGLQMTVHSLKEIVPFLLANDLQQKWNNFFQGVNSHLQSLKEIVPFLLANDLQYVLSERFCQDDLENYFGRQRAIQRRNENPNVRNTLVNDNNIKSGFENGPIEGGNVRPAETIDFEISESPSKKAKL